MTLTERIEASHGGFYPGVPIEEYAADPCPRPSMDTRAALALRDRSQLHARWESPRYNTDAAARSLRTMDIGAAFHSMVLEGKDIVDPVPFSDYKKREAQEWRDTAKACGLIPLVYQDVDTYCEMLEAFRKQGGFDILGREGKPEMSGFYMVGDAWVRTRPDWLTSTGVLSLKTVGSSGSRDEIERRLSRDGWDLQVASHVLGFRTIFGSDASAGWLVMEQEPPFGLAHYPFAASHLELVVRVVDLLAREWGKCVEGDQWNGYPNYDKLPLHLRQWDADAYHMMLDA